MPLYEFICHDCGTQFDALRAMSDADKPIQCKQCKGEHTSRLLSVFYSRSGSRIVACDTDRGCDGCKSRTCATCR